MRPDPTAQTYIVILLDIIQNLNKMGLDKEDYDRFLRAATKGRMGEEISLEKLQIVLFD